MARRAVTTRRRRRRSQVSIFTTNPRRRRRRAAARRTIFARNPARRRRSRARSTATPARRIYRRNPSRRSAARRSTRKRSYRRNPIGMGGVGKLTSLMLPAVFIGAGAVVVEIGLAYAPIPMAWKTGPMRYVVKAGFGVAVGLVIAKAFRQKRLGYYFAAGAVAISVHDFLKTWLNSQAPAVRGLGYVNPASVVKFGQYGRQLPMNRFGAYARPLRSQFGGDAALPNARQPGGEMNFAA